MRILIASACEFPGGTGGAAGFVEMQAKGMASLGHQTSVLVSHGTWVGSKRTHTDGFDAVRCGGPLHVKSGFKRKLARLAAHLRLCLRLAFLSLGRRYDVIVINGPAVGFVPAAAFARLAGRKLYYVQADFVPFGGRVSAAVRLKRALTRRVDVYLAKAASRVVVLGTSALVEHYKRCAPRTPRVRIRAPTDVEAFGSGDGGRARRALGLEGRRMVLYCGSVDSLEGCHVLIEAMPAVKSEHPDSVLVVVGAKLPEDRVLGQPLDYSAMVRELGIEDSVVFTGHVASKSGVIDLLAAADVLVMPKIDHLLNLVAMPIKAAEYLASGRPVVMSRVCELDEFLRDGEDVLFCEPGSSSELARRISQVLDDAELSRKLSKNARLAAERWFDYRQVARAMLEGVSAWCGST